MAIAHSKKPGLYIGLDAGGSSTELLAVVQPGGTEFTCSGPAANLQREGASGSSKVIASLIEQAISQHPEDVVQSICAGVAGAGRPADQHLIAKAVLSRLPGLKPNALHIVHDASIALEAAFDGESGIVLIVGTGSIAFAKTLEGEQLRAGGWGYLIGDEGSGNALGVRGLRAVAAALDGGPATHLQLLLAQRYGISTPDDLIRSVYRDQWPVQRMAPLVVEAAVAGDEVARRIIEKQTHALAQQVKWLAHRARFIAPRIAILGGLSKEKPYTVVLEEALHAVLPSCLIQAPRNPPVVGALQMAMRL